MHKYERKNKMNNDIKLTENDVIKKAILMLKENLLDIKSYINNPMSSTLKLQKVKVEILKANDRLNDIYNVLNANDETKLIEVKKLCNMLHEEVQAIMEEKKYTEYCKQEIKVLNDYDNNNKTTANYKVDEKYIKDFMESNPGYTRHDAEEAFINEMKHWEEYVKEYQKQDQERCERFLKKHNNFRSVFDECYEDKNLDKDMEILKNYLEKNNMLSTSLSISGHDLVVIRAKLAVAKNKSKIGMLVIPEEENKYKTEKDYSRYEIISVKPAYIKSNLSKRKLPTEIFTYLISNNILTAKDFKKYSINQFGRTFEAKMGDIILDNELPETLDRQKRYNKVDFLQYPKSDFKGTLYISNQWDKKSIDKLINNIELNYGQHISIITPEVANIVAYAYDEDISAVDKYDKYK